LEGVNDEAMTPVQAVALAWVIRTTSSSCRAGDAFFTLIPMNFLHSSAELSRQRRVGKKAQAFGKEVGKLNVVASSEASNFDHSRPRPNGR